MNDERQEHLFNAETVEKKRCAGCGAAAKNACGHDADLEHGLISRTRRRPKTCLNSAQLGPDDPLPF